MVTMLIAEEVSEEKMHPTWCGYFNYYHLVRYHLPSSAINIRGIKMSLEITYVIEKGSVVGPSAHTADSTSALLCCPVIYIHQHELSSQFSICFITDI